MPGYDRSSTPSPATTSTTAPADGSTSTPSGPSDPRGQDRRNQWDGDPSAGSDIHTLETANLGEARSAARQKDHGGRVAAVRRRRARAQPPRVRRINDEFNRFEVSASMTDVQNGGADLSILTLLTAEATMATYDILTPIYYLTDVLASFYQPQPDAERVARFGQLEAAARDRARRRRHARAHPRAGARTHGRPGERGRRRQWRARTASIGGARARRPCRRDPPTGTSGTATPPAQRSRTRRRCRC